MRAHISSFAAPESDVRVHFNNSPTQIYVSPELSRERLLQVIDEHERVRISEHWKTLLVEAPAGGYIEALRMREIGGYPAPAYLQCQTWQQLSGVKLRAGELNRYLKRLSITEQRNMVASVMPESRSGLNGVVVLISPVFAPDFREMLGESELPERFVRRLANAFRSGMRNPDFHPIRYLEFLILLWADNLILFPTDFRCWVFRQKWDVLRNERYSKGKAHFIKLVTEVLMETNARDFKGRAYGLLTSSSLKTEHELSLGLIDAYESLLQLEVSALKGPALATARSFNTRVGQTYRLLFNQAHPLLAVAATATRTPKKRRTQSS